MLLYLIFDLLDFHSAEAETKLKLEKVAEIKKINAQMMAIKRWTAASNKRLFLFNIFLINIHYVRWIKWILKYTLVILKIMDKWSWLISGVCQSSAVTLYKVGGILSKGQ